MKAILCGLYIFLFICYCSGQKIDCYVVIAEECPISIYMADEMKYLYEQFSDNVNFNAVFPLVSSTPQSAENFKKIHDLLGYNTILDSDHSLVNELKATVTPEIILRSSDGLVLYRGRLTDAYFSPGRMRHNTTQFNARAALRKILEGRTPKEPWPKAIGCFITPL